MNKALLIVLGWVWASMEFLIWLKMPFPSAMGPKQIRFLFAIIAVLLLTDSIASSQERMIAVELSEAQWNAVAKAIQKEPFGEVVVIMSELQRQVRAAIARDAAELERLRIENRSLKEKNP